MFMWYVGRIARISALIVIASLFMGCGKNLQDDDLPAPNGAFVTITNEHPAVVMVLAPGGAGLCTGTFVSERAVVTASHCVDAAGTYTIVASFGQFRTSTRRLLGPGEVDDPSDLAMLVLDQPAASREEGQIYDFHDSVAEGDELELVGFGCNNISTRNGAGVKRKGRNTVADLNDYIEFLTPITSGSNGTRGLFGPANRTASCFGDSGGPALARVNGGFRLVGITHAGGREGSFQVSQYVNVADRSDNRSFLRDIDREFGLGIRGL